MEGVVGLDGAFLHPIIDMSLWCHGSIIVQQRVVSAGEGAGNELNRDQQINNGLKVPAS